MSSLNPINFRLPLFELESEEGRQAAHRYLASGIVDLNQAIAALSDKVKGTSSTTTIVEQGTTPSGGGSSATSIGVNDQRGVTAYTTQQSDNAVKIILGDASPITVTLDGGVTTPWFTIIDNDSSAIASLVPSGAASLQGDSDIDPGCFGIIVYDGANFWCGATKIATASRKGYVQPDNVTIGIDSGMIYTQITVDSGAPLTHPVTPGNPFYFDSSASPWHGYVYWQGNWNRFS